MKNLTAKCLDMQSPDDLVMHRVTAEINGRPVFVELMANDPMHAIQRAQAMPQHLWKELEHA